MALNFKTPAIRRLKKFLVENNCFIEIKKLISDASTREYFRIKWKKSNAIACVYAETFDKSLPQIEATNFFLQCNLPVARIFEVNFKLGIVIHEDFGDEILSNTLKNSNLKKRENLLRKSINLIAKIQKNTPYAFKLNSSISKLKFDKEKLFQELIFFKIHYFESLRKLYLPKETENALNDEFKQLSRELEHHAKVITHRDFHAANLIVSDNEELKIIDHQDARIGPSAYDLASLLLDRITRAPSQKWLDEKKSRFLIERENLGLERIEADTFNYEFDMVTIQRCLKAIGTFSNQGANFGKAHYLDFVKPMFEVVLQSCDRLNKFPALRETLSLQVV